MQPIRPPLHGAVRTLFLAPRAVALLVLGSPALAGAQAAPKPVAEPQLEIELAPTPEELAPRPLAEPPPEPEAQSTSIAIEIGSSDARRERRDGGADAAAPDAEEDEEVLLHGFRLGYLFLNNHDVPVDPDDPSSSLAERHGLRSPHQFLIGYEVANRVTGSGWLNILLVGNVMVSGLEQSKVFPSGNLLLGFEFAQSFQTGVGVNLVPVRDKPAHMVLAAGWTPKMGDMYLPLHFFFIPDVDDNHRLGVTVGVNWGA